MTSQRSGATRGPHTSRASWDVLRHKSFWFYFLIACLDALHRKILHVAMQNDNCHNNDARLLIPSGSKAVRQGVPAAIRGIVMKHLRRDNRLPRQNHPTFREIKTRVHPQPRRKHQPLTEIQQRQPRPLRGWHTGLLKQVFEGARGPLWM